MIQRLSEWGYLDDAAFAERWVRARLSRRPTGRRGLEAELLTRGLDRETVQHAVERAVGARSERELAELVLARRLPSGARSAARAKALLARHGFDEDVITGLVGSPDAGWQEPDRPDA